MTDCRATLAEGPQVIAEFSDAIKRTAITIETFHKASLVHDDIEDNDAYRYGQETLHHTYGVPTAINVGDYLVSLGYRLIAEDRKSLGSETAADILAYLADAHGRLCEGQGAELIWRDAKNKRLKPIEPALKVYWRQDRTRFRGRGLLRSSFSRTVRTFGQTDQTILCAKSGCRFSNH